METKDTLTLCNNRLDLYIKEMVEIMKKVLKFHVPVTHSNGDMKPPSKDYFTKVMDYVYSVKRFSSAYHDKDFQVALKYCLNTWIEAVNTVKVPTRASSFLNKICNTGRKLAALYFLGGNYYEALLCLRKVSQLSADADTRKIVLRWCILLSEWEILEAVCQFEESQKKKTKELSDLMNLAKLIHSFHRSQKMSSLKEVARELRDRAKELEEKREKSFPVYESLVLIYYTLSLFPRSPSFSSSEMSDSLCYIDRVVSRTSAILHSRISDITSATSCPDWFERSANANEFLKLCASAAEHLDLCRLGTMERIECGLLSEAASYSMQSLLISLKLSHPFRIISAINSFLLSKKLSLIDNEHIRSFCTLITAFFSPDLVEEEPSPGGNKENEGKAKRKESCSAIADAIQSLCLKDRDVHFPDEKCECAMCEEASECYSFAMECAFSRFLFSETPVSDAFPLFNAHREKVGPLQLKLMEKENARPRPPVLLSEMICRMASISHPPDSALPFIKKAASYAGLVCYPSYLAMKQEERKRKPKGKGAKTVGELDELRTEYAKHSHLLYRQWRLPLCMAIAGKTDDPWEAAMMWTETTALSVRQTKRLLAKNPTSVQFNRVEEFKKAVTMLPPDVTVVQLLRDCKGGLVLVKLHAARTPIVMQVADGAKVKNLMLTFTKILKENDASCKSKNPETDAQKFWENRRRVDDMMRDGISMAEKDVLGPFVALMEPVRVHSKQAQHFLHLIQQKAFDEKSSTQNIPSNLAMELLDRVTRRQVEWTALVNALGERIGLSKKQINAISCIYKELPESREELFSGGAGYVFFVLSPDVSVIPWESLPSLEGLYSGRVISFHHLQFLLRKEQVIPRSADPNDAFYVLDPGGNLEETKKRISKALEGMPWKGVTGSAPDTGTISSVFTNNDFFFYIGHGSGDRYISRSLVRRLECRSVVVLMGCSSVSVEVEGTGLDGRSAVHDYCVAGCPCVVGCLWMVTDGEIDRYFIQFLHLFSSSTTKSPIRTLVESLAKARSACRLKYLTGASVVCYGLPIKAMTAKKIPQ